MSPNRPILCIFVVLLAFNGCAGESAKTPESRRKPSRDADGTHPKNPLEGTWEITSAEINGESFPIEGQPDLHVGGRYHFEGDTLTKYANPEFPGISKVGLAHRFQVDTKKSPPDMTIQQLGEGPNGPWPSERLIFQIENETLRLCWSLPGGPPPKEFRSADGDNVGLYELRRVKK